MLMKSNYRGLRETFHQSRPPAAITITPEKIMMLNLLPGDSVFVSEGVAVSDTGVTDGEGEGVVVAGAGVNVTVAGGVTSRSNFCSVRMMEVLFSPFQFIKSESGTAYRPAMYESVSPLCTV